MVQRTKSLNVAVVGAGITGLTLAAALRRAGVDCEVYERTPAFGRIGAGIQLAPNATRLLHQLGLADPLSRVAVRSTAIEVRSGETGALSGRVPLDDCEDRFGAPYCLLTRADLHSLLASAVPEGTVRFGKACQSLDETPEGVEIRFTDGTSARADVVVGADGIRSGVRQGRVRDEPVYSGLSVHRGLVPTDRLPSFFGEPRSTLWSGEGKHFVSYPVAAGRLVNFVATLPARQWHAESWSEPGEVADVAAAFADWDEALHTLITAAESVTRWALHTRNADLPWSTHRTTLAGDAAHPMLPFMAQGANQGIEDAFALASALAGGDPTDPAGALRRYEHARRPRALMVQQMSAGAARSFHAPDGDTTVVDALGALTDLFAHDAELLEPSP
ncbi:FAD-dependent monooxygenase [Streptomyces paludis]|uniref:Salicylate 1-monooxygenase n=1 Tax=Streptomyces paludis TaxID=2282738 RepID=A0A345HS50_9ACTN|nr:FAD-dependent monooxygenase [Streptomyces paludis]AXG79524.1 salicylate 1-monooxygenase [Streptomyces paludis]